ncbi:MAG: c-type cytochrome [Sphingobacteriales bacterium]|nr:MAG: c-type cytochrome [Sphingobacteriales bacterium]
MKIIKVIAVIIISVVLLSAMLATYVYVALPADKPVAALQIERTPARIERGKYLATHVAVCIDCHSTRDWSAFSGPVVPGTLGKGGGIMDHSKGFPGDIRTPNITPFGLKDWSDGELVRAITTGVSKNGKAIFPLMAYPRFGAMDKEDIYSIVAYIRTLQPIENVIPETTLDFPVNLINNTLPRDAHFTDLPDEKNIIKYGKYLVNAAGCVDCHSKNKNGKIIKGTEFGGGMEFKQPAGIIRAPNITMNKENGIGHYTSESFVIRFKAYADSSYKLQKLTPGELNSPMPWIMYSGMKTSDLEAIFAYLNSVKTLDNDVEVRSLKKK